MSALSGAWLLIVATIAAAFGAWTALGPASLLPPGRDRWTAGCVAVAATATLIAFGVLTAAFVRNDFSIAYVADNSNTALPLFYRITAVWGEHAGSLFLWAALLAVGCLLVLLQRQWPSDERRITAGVMGAMLGCLAGSLSLTADFFAPADYARADQGSLNPILQDPAMASHPPLLYIGYSALAVPFALTIAALLAPDTHTGWAQRARPWLLVGWVSLTASLAAGSWWSHYELGWGGWWFWDPVENAALIPWLVATALLHSLAITATRGLWPGWTQALAIAGFATCILGVLLGRIGAFSSIHTFANDPDSALLTTYPMAVVLLGSVALWGKGHSRSRVEATFPLVARESALLLASTLLATTAALVAIGTLYGPVSGLTGGASVAVGGSYFNVVFLVPIVITAAAAAIGMHTAWGRVARWPLVGWQAAVVASMALAGGTLAPWILMGAPSLIATAGLASGSLLCVAALLPGGGAARGTSAARLTRLGMHVAHGGLGLCLIGITWASAYGIESDFRFAMGEPVELAGYRATLEEISTGEGPNYAFTRGTFLVVAASGTRSTVHSEKRDYRDNRPWLTEAGILSGWHRDLLVQLGEPLGGGAWSVRLQYRPLVRWIWLGGTLMALGGLLAAVGRYSSLREPAVATKAHAVPPGRELGGTR